MLSSVEQAFVGRDEKRASLKTPAWEARVDPTQAISPSGALGKTSSMTSPTMYH